MVNFFPIIKKNFLIEKSNLISNTFQILLPTISITLLIVFKSLFFGFSPTPLKESNYLLYISNYELNKDIIYPIQREGRIALISNEETVLNQFLEFLKNKSNIF